MVEKFDIEGPVLITNRIFKDERGMFFESFNHKGFEDIIGEKVSFVQDNLSASKLNVVRGLHFQKPPYEQGKLVRVLKGKVIDIAVDLRFGSATYGQHVSVELSRENNKMFWVPPGFAHGFSVLEDDTIFSYKCTNYYNQESEVSLLWNDELLKLDWKVEEPTLSEKDKIAQTFKMFTSPF
jgi:dTDP-4-dehydrorhamnose 3,5-epimerase